MPQTSTIDVPSLATQVHRLVASFARVRDKKAVEKGRKTLPVQYDDADYIYLEVELPEHGDLQGDISIWSGRAVIRISR